MASPVRLERHQAVVRLIREEPDIECPLQLVGLPVRAEFRNRRPPNVRAPVVTQTNDITTVPEEIRVRVSPHGLDAFDVGTGESVALGVEIQQAFGEFEEPGIALELAVNPGRSRRSKRPEFGRNRVGT